MRARSLCRAGASPYDKVTDNFAFEGEVSARALASAETGVDANNYLV